MKMQQIRLISACVGVLAIGANTVTHTSPVAAKDLGPAQINTANSISRAVGLPSPGTPPTTIASGQRFGAFVYSASLKRYGTSWGAQTRQSAALTAMQFCFQMGATDCQLVTIYDTYGVIVRAQNGYTTWAVGASREDTERQAIATCLNESPFPSTCKVIVSRSSRGDSAYGFNPMMPQLQVFAGR
jgi:hypothetical protein